MRACDHRRRQPHAAPTTTATNRDPRRSFAPDATRTTHTHRRTGPPLRQPAILPSRQPAIPPPPRPLRHRARPDRTPITPRRRLRRIAATLQLPLSPGALSPNFPFSLLLLLLPLSATDRRSDRHIPKSLTCHLAYPYLAPLPSPPPFPPTTTEIPVDDAMLKHVKRITASTGKAAWISATAFLVLIVPLIIEMDREQQLIDLEAGQLDALTGGSAASA